MLLLSILKKFFLRRKCVVWLVESNAQVNERIKINVYKINDCKLSFIL